MKAMQARNFKMFPAKPGTCSVCASNHEANLPHNLASIFYGVHFRLRYGRDATWSDACAHLPAEMIQHWKQAMRDVGQEWTQHDEPIAEPYAVSDPFGKRVHDKP